MVTLAQTNSGVVVKPMAPFPKPMAPFPEDFQPHWPITILLLRVQQPRPFPSGYEVPTLLRREHPSCLTRA